MSTIPSKAEALAIHGGKPVRRAMLPYGRQSLHEEDVAAVVNVLRSDWLTTGPKVDEFEERFAEWIGAKHAVTVCSGTAALHTAAFAAGLQPGDEAVTTPLTFCATANCVLYQGASPVFADVTSDTLNIDPEQVEARMSPRTKAIIAVDYAGHPAELEPLQALARRRGCVFIEDACHALGATYRGRRVGTIADLTVFSFHPVKHLTTGEGGMVTTDDPKLAEKMRRFRNHGISTEARQRQESGQWFYEMGLLGFNYRLTDIACALGLSQIPRLDENLARRRAIASRYNAAFRGVKEIIVPAVLPEADSAWHLYPIRLKLEALSARRAEIFRALRGENIGVNVHYVPVHKHPFYRGLFGAKGETFPVAEDAYERLISLPMFHGMTDEDVEEVIFAVRKVISAFRVE